MWNPIFLPFSRSVRVVELHDMGNQSLPRPHLDKSQALTNNFAENYMRLVGDLKELIQLTTQTRHMVHHHYLTKFSSFSEDRSYPGFEQPARRSARKPNLWQANNITWCQATLTTTCLRKSEGVCIWDPLVCRRVVIIPKTPS